MIFLIDVAAPVSTAAPFNSEWSNLVLHSCSEYLHLSTDPFLLCGGMVPLKSEPTFSPFIFTTLSPHFGNTLITIIIVIYD
jgi:hypothetical protein